MRLIALTGPIDSGKSEIGKFLLWDHAYHRYPFAGRLKRMLEAFGLTAYEMTVGKEVPLDNLCGKTPRYAMQTLGTEWRNMLGEDLWIRNWVRDIRCVTRVVVDDLRFPLEYETVKKLGGFVVRVHRPGVKYTHTDHASEQYMAPYDHQLSNDGDLSLLRQKVIGLERELYGKD